MKVNQDYSAQIFLSLWLGASAGMFLDQYILAQIISLAVKSFANPWMELVHIAIGLIALAAIVWTSTAIWEKRLRALQVSVFMIAIIFLVRLGKGIADMLGKNKALTREAYIEVLVDFIVEMVLNLAGLIAISFLTSHTQE